MSGLEPHWKMGEGGRVNWNLRKRNEEEKKRNEVS